MRVDPGLEKSSPLLAFLFSYGEAAAGAASEEGIFLNCLQKLTAPGQLLRSACGQFFIGHKVHLFHINLRRVLGIAAHTTTAERRGEIWNVEVIN